MNLSNYVVRTVQNGENVFHDLTQHKSLPISSSEEVLSANYFLAGQEQDALFNVLFRNRKRLILAVIPTWACNLRCTHCVVRDRLKIYPAQDEPGIDVRQLTDFISRYIDAYAPQSVQLRFGGGESLLCWEKVREIIHSVRKIGVSVKFNITTNLTIDLNNEIIELLKEFNILGVSVDGSEEYHNAQRVPLGDINPYQTVMGNLKKLMLAGLRDKVYVQAAVKERTEEGLKNYFRAMLKVGVKKEFIKYAAITPHASDSVPHPYYLTALKSGHFMTPCCKYQLMSHFAVSPYNTLHTDFYGYELLGNLTSSLSDLSIRFKESILGEMPVLLDAKCQKCPVIGYCWGNCANNNLYYTLNAGPSSVCDQELLITNINKSAEEGTLL